MKIAVLGAGMVGRTIAEDLSQSFEVTSVDRSPEHLQLVANRAQQIQTIQFDLMDYDSYPRLLRDFDMVVTAVPGFMGYKTLQHVIASGKDVVDISFSPEDVLELHELAIAQQVTAIVDCGVAPGMGNLILGRYNEEMTIDSFECYVGGLPKQRVLPFEYKAPFSPIDVIEEYTRPARLKENGFVVTKPALSEIELMDFEEVGTLEAFNTDGLRSILETMPHIPNLKEKTLRYPGHASLIMSLQRAGFFATEPVDINGIVVSPLHFTTSILFKEWHLAPMEEEYTVMCVLVKGIKEGIPASIEYRLLDRYDITTKTTSMARSTGYTCTGAVHLIAQKLFKKKGVYPPELIGSDPACFDYILGHLSRRNVMWKKKEL